VGVAGGLTKPEPDQALPERLRRGPLGLLNLEAVVAEEPTAAH
jgi:hypothetical protein